MNIEEAIEFPHDYFLRKLTFGDLPYLEIEEDVFNRLKSAKCVLLAAHSIEEKYDVVLENYIHLEQEIANVCVQRMVRRSGDYSESYQTVRDLNVRISNLLSATKMYVDHLKADLSTLEGTKGFVSQQLSECRENKHYRLMEGVRNYAQHVRMPIKTISVVADWNMLEGKKGTSFHHLKVQGSKEELKRIRELRKTLDKFDEVIDLKYSIGKYVSLIGKLHVEVRTKISEMVREGRELFQQHIEQYLAASGEEKALGLAAIKSGNQEIAESVYLNLEWDDIRLDLVRRNAGIRDFSISYVTTISETTMEIEQGNSKKA